MHTKTPKSLCTRKSANLMHGDRHTHPATRLIIMYSNTGEAPASKHRCSLPNCDGLSSISLVFTAKCQTGTKPCEQRIYCPRCGAATGIIEGGDKHRTGNLTHQSANVTCSKCRLVLSTMTCTVGRFRNGVGVEVLTCIASCVSMRPRKPQNRNMAIKHWSWNDIKI